MKRVIILMSLMIWIFSGCSDTDSELTPDYTHYLNNGWQDLLNNRTSSARENFTQAMLKNESTEKKAELGMGWVYAQMNNLTSLYEAGYYFATAATDSDCVLESSAGLAFCLNAGNDCDSSNSLINIVLDSDSIWVSEYYSIINFLYLNKLKALNFCSMGDYQSASEIIRLKLDINQTDFYSAANDEMELARLVLEYLENYQL